MSSHPAATQPLSTTIKEAFLSQPWRDSITVQHRQDALTSVQTARDQLTTALTTDAEGLPGEREEAVLAALAAARTHLDAATLSYIRYTRRRRPVLLTWDAIARAFGITKQSAHERWARLIHDDGYL